MRAYLRRLWHVARNRPIIHKTSFIGGVTIVDTQDLLVSESDFRRGGVQIIDTRRREQYERLMERFGGH